MVQEADKLYEGLEERRGRKPVTEEAKQRTAATLAASADAYLSGDALFNDPVATLESGRTVLQKEQPHHRLFASLRARGYTIKEIAGLTGYSAAAVGLVLRQPFARQRLVEAMQKDEEAISAILRAEAAPSIELLVEVRDDEEARRADRLRAAENLLDRYLGKPTQRVETHEAPPPVDVEECQREIEALRKERANLLNQ